MGTLNELVGKWLKESDCLKSILAKYDEEPAVFYWKSPGDNEPGWEDGKYPRIEYHIDRQEDRERKSAGTLTLSILCEGKSFAYKEIEKTVKERLFGKFLQPTGQEAYCHAWRTSTPIPSNGDSASSIEAYGVELLFDLYEFPCQTTSIPDPVLSLAKGIQQAIPNAVILGIGEERDVIPTDEDAPVFYIQIRKQSVGKENYSVLWMEFELSVHVFHPTKAGKTRWIRHIVDWLAFKGKIPATDDSTMTLKEIKAEGTVDSLITGQITVTVEIGVLKHKEQVGKLRNVYVNETKIEKGG